MGKLEGRWQAWHGQGLMVVGHGAYEHGHMTSTHSHGGHMDMDILAYGCMGLGWPIILIQMHGCNEVGWTNCY